MAAEVDRFKAFSRAGDWSEWDPTVDVYPSLGRVAVEWIEANCICGEGDAYGEPARLLDDWRRFCFEWFEYVPAADGGFTDWRYKRGLIGEPKGAAKTQNLGWIAKVSTFGPAPIAPKSALTRIAAASYGQADELFGCVQVSCGGQGNVVTAAPLCGMFEVYDQEVLRADGKPGRIQRVAAAAGTSDGAKPTLFLADELHEWIGNKARVHIVNSNGIRKRKTARELNISTAGVRGSTPPAAGDSLLWKMYYAGREAERRGEPGRLLFRWREAAEHWQLDDPSQLEAAIREAGGSAADELWSVEDRIERFHDVEIDQSEFRRYFLNQWTNTTDEWWLSDDPDAWYRNQIDQVEIPVDVEVMAGVDLSLRNDSTAVGLVWVGADGRKVWRAKVWESKQGRIDYLGVEAFLIDVARKHRLVGVAYDPRYMEIVAQRLEDDHGLLMVEISQAIEMRRQTDLHAYQQIVSDKVCHEGDPVLTDHVENARWRERENGRVLSKSISGGCIDALMACSFADWFFDHRPEAEEPYREPELVIV